LNAHCTVTPVGFTG